MQVQSLTACRLHCIQALLAACTVLIASHACYGVSKVNDVVFAVVFLGAVLPRHYVHAWIDIVCSHQKGKLECMWQSCMYFTSALTQNDAFGHVYTAYFVDPTRTQALASHCNEATERSGDERPTTTDKYADER